MKVAKEPEKQHPFAQAKQQLGQAGREVLCLSRFLVPCPNVWMPLIPIAFASHPAKNQPGLGHGAVEAEYGDLARVAGQAAQEKAKVQPSFSPVLAAELTGQARDLEPMERMSFTMDSTAQGFRLEEPRGTPTPAAEECSACGAGYMADARFCSRCGQRRPGETPTPQTPPATPPGPKLRVPSLSTASSWALQGQASWLMSTSPHATTSSQRSETRIEDVQLREIVGQQQLQLGALQQQLQGVQDILARLAAQAPAPPLPAPVAPCPAAPPAPPAPAVPAPEAPEALEVLAPVTKVDACVGASLEEAKITHSVQTSPLQQMRTVSAGLQVAPVLLDAAVNVGDSLCLPKPKSDANLRDSADTAGGASPRPANYPQLSVPRIICPSDLSPCGSEDSDGSLELLGDWLPNASNAPRTASRRCLVRTLHIHKISSNAG
ncbi:unnamed protein product [Effrenium voratum]|nr:unnamed protein product [Effrenium voratum]